MYSIIKSIIDHVYSSQYSYEEQYIYAICGVLICILTVVFLDLLYRFFHKIIN